MSKTTIKLTGRKSLPYSAFDFDWVQKSNGVATYFQILDNSCLESFSLDARIRVVLRENKNVHFAEFGTLGSTKASFELKNVELIAPSVELRIVDQGTDKENLLLGSSKLPKISTNGDMEGILHFQTKDTSPFLWDLAIEEDHYPVLYLNNKMEEKLDPILWVKSNPLFMISIFPTVIENVFMRIYDSEGSVDEGWMCDWVEWAERSMGCEKFSEISDDEDFEKWIFATKSQILAKMGLLPEALSSLVSEDK